MRKKDIHILKKITILYIFLKMKHVTTKYKNLMTKENFLLHKHVGNGSKNTKKDTQTWNIKKKRKKKVIMKEKFM